MNYKYLSLLLAFSCFLAVSSFAHEGDEEVTIKNAPRFGGKVAAVVLDEDHNKMNRPLPKHDHSHKEEKKVGAKDEHEHDEHNEAKFMSEILVSDENKVRLYFYNTEMKDIDLAGFPNELVINIQSKDINQPRGQNIKLKKNGKNYIGELPVIKKKPYDMSIDFIAQNLVLHISFNSMD